MIEYFIYTFIIHLQKYTYYLHIFIYSRHKKTKNTVLAKSIQSLDFTMFSSLIIYDKTTQNMPCTYKG